MSSRDVVERLRTRRVRAEVKTAEGSVWVRGLSGKERHEYYAWTKQANVGDAALLGDQRLVALTLCDEAGANLFETLDDGLVAVTDWNVEDVALLAREALRLSGMAVRAVDDAEKKS